MNQTNTMKEMLVSERPYEKCDEKGAGSLSDAELLSVLLRTGTRGRKCPGAFQENFKRSRGGRPFGTPPLYKRKFMKIRGVGKVKTIQLLCILELSARLAKAEARKTLCFRNPSTIAGYYMEEMRHLSQEHMKLLMLDTKSNLIAEKNIYKGTVNASLVEPREIFCGGGKKGRRFLLFCSIIIPVEIRLQAKRMWRLLGG